jgi:hypothetical protein
VTTTAAAAGTRRHTGTYPAEPRQVGIARAALAGWLGRGPQADDAVLVASEFATNSDAPRGALLYPRCSRGELKGGSRA